MEIHGPGGIPAPERPEARTEAMRGIERPADAERIADRVEISEEAQYLEKLSEVPPLRHERIAELRRLIEAGEYETLDRIEKAAERLLEEI